MEDRPQGVPLHDVVPARSPGPRARKGPGASPVMRTDTSTLPPIDPARTPLDILRDALDLMEDYLPTVPAGPGDRWTDCAVCGYVLSNPGSDAAGHAEHDDQRTGRGKCRWLRAVAELQAWVRVEERLEEERQDREDEA